MARAGDRADHEGHAAGRSRCASGADRWHRPPAPAMRRRRPLRRARAHGPTPLRMSTAGTVEHGEMTELDWFIVAFAAMLACFRLPAGLHRRGALLRRVRARRIPRHAPRSAAAARGLLLAVRARLRADRRAARRRDPRERAGGPRLQAAPRAVPPGPGPARRRCSARRSARRSLWASCGSLAAVAAQTPGQSGAARATSSARRSCASSTSCCRRPGSILNALARLDPLPSIAGPSPDVAAPQPAVARDAGCAQRLAQRRARARHRLRPGDRGLGLGGRSRTRWSPTRTSSPASRTRRSSSAAHSPSLPARAIAFDPSNDLAVLRVPGLAVPALSLVAEPDSGTAGAILGYPENGPFDVQPGRIGRTQTVITQNAYGAGAGLAAADPAARPGAPGQLRRAGGRRRRAGADDGVRRRPSAAARTAATASPTRPSRACSPSANGAESGEHGALHRHG